MGKMVRLLLSLFLVTALVGPMSLTSCRGKKKLAEEEARKAEAALQAEKLDLLTQIDKLMINQVSDYDDWESRMAAMNTLQSGNTFKDDAEVKSAFAKLNSFLNDERERLDEERTLKKLQEEQKKKDINQFTANKIDAFFQVISSAETYNQANDMIVEALDLFQSSETPVLILLDQYDGDTAYDKPTTAQRYLEYLKDQRKNLYRVNKVELDDAGLIKSLELIRSY